MAIKEKNKCLSKVFVVEDEDFLRLILSEELRKIGFTVFSFPNGKIALDHIFYNPDLIIMDCSMPVMDGITAFKILKDSSDTCKIPIIMISADDVSTSSCNCLFLPKPFHFQELKSIIQNISYS